MKSERRSRLASCRASVIRSGLTLDQAQRLALATLTHAFQDALVKGCVEDRNYVGLAKLLSQRIASEFEVDIVNEMEHMEFTQDKAARVRDQLANVIVAWEYRKYERASDTVTFHFTRNESEAKASDQYAMALTYLDRSVFEPTRNNPSLIVRMR